MGRRETLKRKYLCMKEKKLFLNTYVHFQILTKKTKTFKHGQLRLLCKRRPGIDTIDKQRLKMWHVVVNFTMNNAVILATII